MPDTGLLDTLNVILPFIPTIVIALVAVVGFWYYRYKYQPEIARRFTKAFHTRALAAFLQDDMGNVSLEICDKKFPEGIVHIKNKGWFLLPKAPEVPTFESEVLELPPGVKKRGRPLKNPVAIANNLEKQKQYEKEIEAAAKILVQTPILRGFGKQVFFGSTRYAPLHHLGAIAHADLPDVARLGPSQFTKTTLDAIAVGNRLEGLHMSGRETTKLLMYALIVIAPIAVTGIIAWLLTSGGK